MSLEQFDPASRVCLAIVALGTPQRLRDCLDSLVQHESRHAFSVVCVINPTRAFDAEDEIELPGVVRVIRPELNVGWPGGLHIARAATQSEYLVWVQDDMQVTDGWLDALVDAADANPDTAAFGSVTVNTEGRASAVGAGSAEPFHDVDRWNETGYTGAEGEAEIRHADWITGKGMLTRTSAWDLVGGADPRQYPVNLVDKDYSTHLRAHGLRVALVPSARLLHLQGQSAPSMFRRFVSEYRNPDFNRQWGRVVEMLAPRATAVPHLCAPWFADTTSPQQRLAAVQRIAGREASTMLIAFAKWSDRFVDTAVGHQRDVSNHAQSVALADAHSAVVRSYERALSWRITRPLRALRRALSRAR